MLFGIEKTYSWKNLVHNQVVKLQLLISYPALLTYHENNYGFTVLTICDADHLVLNM